MKSKSKTGLALVALIIIAVIVGVLASPGQQNHDTETNQSTSTNTASTTAPTTIPDSWEAYENARLDVTAAHPPKASVRTEGPQDRRIKFTYLGDNNATGQITDGFTLTVSVFADTDEPNLRSFVTSQIQENGPGRQASDIATTSFRNATALSYTTQTTGTIQHTAFRPSENRIVIISSSISDPNDNNYQQLVDQVTASLDFSTVSGENSQPAGKVSKVELMMLERNLADGEQPDRGCDQIRAVTRSVQPTQAPLTKAIEELFAIDRSNVQGFYNFIAETNDTLQFDRAVVEDGTANIYLTGELSGLSGVCDNPRAATQIEETAKQFSTVEDVQIYRNGEPTDLTPSGRQ